MNQRLILPMDDLRVWAGYQNPEIPSPNETVHPWIDCRPGNRTARSPGDGRVVSTGNGLLLICHEVLCSAGVICTLACRMEPFETLSARPGAQVRRGDPLGLCGMDERGPLFRIAFNLDWRSAETRPETAVDPAAVWFLGPGQRLSGAEDGRYRPEELLIPPLPGEAVPEDARREEEQAVARARERLAKLRRLLGKQPL